MLAEGQARVVTENTWRGTAWMALGILGQPGRPLFSLCLSFPPWRGAGGRCLAAAVSPSVSPWQEPFQVQEPQELARWPSSPGVLEAGPPRKEWLPLGPRRPRDLFLRGLTRALCPTESWPADRLQASHGGAGAAASVQSEPRNTSGWDPGSW